MSSERYTPDVKVDHARMFRTITALLQQGKVNDAWSAFQANLIAMGDFGGALGVSPPYPGDNPVVPVITVGWPLPNGPNGAPFYSNYDFDIDINTVVSIPLDLPPGPYPLSDFMMPSAVSINTSQPPIYLATLSLAPGLEAPLIQSQAPEVSTPYQVTAGGPIKPSTRAWFNLMIKLPGAEGQTRVRVRFQWSPPH